MPARDSLGRRIISFIVGHAPEAVTLTPAARADATPISPDPELLQTLIKEYELSWNSLEQSVGRNVQLSTAILTALAAVVGIVPQIKLAEHWPLVMVAPAFFLVLFGILLFELCTSHAHIWACRVLAARINSLFPDTPFIRFEPSYPSASVFSFGRGPWRVRALNLIMLAGPFAIFIGLLVTLTVLLADCASGPDTSPAATSGATSASAISAAQSPIGSPQPPDPTKPIRCPSHAPWTFGALWFSLTLAEILLIPGPLSQIPDRFRHFFDGAAERGAFPARVPVLRRRRSGPGFGTRLSRIGRFLFFWIMPRPWDFAAKAACFWIGFATALTTVVFAVDRFPVPPEHVARLNTFVAPVLAAEAPWTATTVPAAALVLLGLLYFLIEEVGFQQAKFLYDDSLKADVQRDQSLLQNQGWRAVSAGIMSPAQARDYAIIRALLCLALAHWIGGFWLTAALVLVAAHQGLYMYVFKPLAGTMPLAVLFWISLNLVPRIFAGVVAVLDGQWVTLGVALLLGTFVCASLGGMAAQWKMEALHHGPAARPQGAYLARYGEAWQHIGLIAAVLMGGLLLLSHLVIAPTWSICGFQPAFDARSYVGRWLDQDTPLNSTLSVSIETFWTVLVVAPLVCLLMAWLVLWPAWRTVTAANSASRSGPLGTAPSGGGIPSGVFAISVGAAALGLGWLGQSTCGISWQGLAAGLLGVGILKLVVDGWGRQQGERQRSKVGGRIKAVVLRALWVIGLTLASLSFVLHEANGWLGFVFLLQIGLLINYEGMTYPEFALGGMAAKKQVSTPGQT